MYYYTLVINESEKKRKRGAQPGNKNARKHGLYSMELTPQEICRFWHEYHRNDTDPVLVVLRIKIESALRSTPDNRRVIREATRLLARWYRYRYGLNAWENAVFKQFVRELMEVIGKQFKDSAGTNHAQNEENGKKSSPSTEAENIVSASTVKK